MFRKKTTHTSPIEMLINAPGLWNLSPEQRKDLTVSCRDTDYIKKVKDAGKIKKVKGRDVQVMHDGTMVLAGGYHGDWMADVISELRGHHEPQEEKVFFEVLKRVKSDSWMIELGSFWAYYSIWFSRFVNRSHNICCEPDPNNISLGEMNSELNNVSLNFIQSAAGSKDGDKVDVTMDSDSTKTVNLSVRTVDSLVEEFQIDKLELVHIDVQGFEHDALKGCVNSIKNKKLRFVFISTHHYVFSNNPNTHEDCMKFVVNHGGNIISSHTIPESFSGDGLIVASFSDEDKDFKVSTSIAHTDKSLFRPYERDLRILIDYMNGRKK